MGCQNFVQLTEKQRQRKRQRRKIPAEREHSAVSALRERLAAQAKLTQTNLAKEQQMGKIGSAG